MNTPPRPQIVILNVDDDDQGRCARTDCLGSAGFHVVEARTGAEALQIAFGACQRPDLVLLGVRLPDLDGFEVCARLRASPLCDDVPIIHITAAFNSPADCVRGLEVEADTYLVQPIESDLLIAAVRAVLRRRSKQLEANAARERAETEYRTLVDRAPFGIYRSTSDGHFLSVNSALVMLLGYENEGELTRTPLMDIYRDPQDRARVVQAFNERPFGRAETEWKRKDGQVVTVSLVGRAVARNDRRPEGYEIFVEDISERRRLEEQLRQSQKMEAIGRLAGGVAHDFNNLLTVIVGYTDMLLEQLGVGQPISQDLAQIKQAADRAASLTRQLLAFGRKQVLRMAVVDLNEVTTSIQSMIRPLIREDVEIQLQLASDLGRVVADVTHLEQVIINLAVNARDAMPSGGQLTFQTLNVVIADEYVSSHEPVMPGSYVMLSVSDTGIGMDDQTMRHIFEPFFTTKPFGEGTGLGLATVYGIVKQLGGYTWVYSEIGLGTTFKLYFPQVSRESATRAADVTGLRGGAPLGREIILLAEDEPGVRKLAAATLKRYGYTVLEACSGAEAITLSDRLPSKIDLLLTDVIMPNMNGAELATRIRKSRRNICVLFMSGYSAEALTKKGTLHRGVELIEKPFSPRALLDRVRALLDRGGARAQVNNDKC